MANKWSEKVTFYLEDVEVGTPFSVGRNNYHIIYSATCRGVMEGLEHKAMPWWKTPETPWDKYDEDEMTDAKVLDVDIDFCAAYKDSDDVEGRIERAEEPDILLVHKGKIEDRLFRTLKRDGKTIEEYLTELGEKCMWKMWDEGYDLDYDHIFTEQGDYLNV